MIETAILSILKNSPAINSIVSDRIYPVYIPQGITDDCITYQQIGQTEPYTCEGAIGLIDARFQITCWSGSHVTVVKLAAAVKAAFQFYQNSVEGIQGTKIEGITDIPYIGEAEAQNRFGRMIDVIISYSE